MGYPVTPFDKFSLCLSAAVAVISPRGDETTSILVVQDGKFLLAVSSGASNTVAYKCRQTVLCGMQRAMVYRRSLNP
jgi:hypothetical protein